MRAAQGAHDTDASSVSKRWQMRKYAHLPLRYYSKKIIQKGKAENEEVGKVAQVTHVVICTWRLFTLLPH
jgi:hypothetical protein